MRDYMGRLSTITRYKLEPFILEERSKGKSIYDIAEDVKSVYNVDITGMTIHNFLKKATDVVPLGIAKNEELQDKVSREVVDKMINTVQDISSQLDRLKPIVTDIQNKIDSKLATGEIPLSDFRAMNETLRTMIKLLELYEKMEGSIIKPTNQTINNFSVDQLNLEVNKILNQLIDSGKLKKVEQIEEFNYEINKGDNTTRNE